MGRRILITGANGLLGQKLSHFIGNKPDNKCILLGRGGARFPLPMYSTYIDADITQYQKIRQIFEKEGPEVVVHTAAITNVDKCQLEPELCHKVNVEATQHLLECSRTTGAHFIFLSTDFVFDGKKGYYTEEDTPNPLSIYAHSKWEGEKLVMSYKGDWCIVRTVLIYGVSYNPSKKNIVLSIKEKLARGETVNVVYDQFRTPTLAEDLAWGISRIIELKATGIFNICGRDLLSILGMAYEIADFWEYDRKLINPVDSRSLGAPAPRPPITYLDISKAMKVLGYMPLRFRDSLHVVDVQLRHMG